MGRVDNSYYTLHCICKCAAEMTATSHQPADTIYYIYILWYIILFKNYVCRERVTLKSHNEFLYIVLYIRYKKTIRVTPTPKQVKISCNILHFPEAKCGKIYLFSRICLEAISCSYYNFNSNLEIETIKFK